MKPEITIVLVNYNGWYWLEKCLGSFSSVQHWSPDPEKSWIKTIVVDNGSNDDSVRKIKHNFPWVKVLALPKNLGFSGGNNVGIQAVDTSYVMLLNTDTEFFPGTDLWELIEVFNREGRVGIVSPKVVLDSGELDHACHRGFPTPWNALTYFSGLSRRFPKAKWLTGYEMSWADLKTRHEIDCCTGAAMLVKKGAIDEVGLLDESYFMYGEDIDWCYRFREKGWKIIYDPAVIVRHHKHKSGLGKEGEWETKLRTTEAFFEAMKQFIRKFYSQRYPVFIRLAIFAVIDTMKKRKIYRERKRYVSK